MEYLIVNHNYLAVDNLSVAMYTEHPIQIDRIVHRYLNQSIFEHPELDYNHDRIVHCRVVMHNLIVHVEDTLYVRR